MIRLSAALLCAAKIAGALLPMTSWHLHRAQSMFAVECCHIFQRADAGRKVYTSECHFASEKDVLSASVSAISRHAGGYSTIASLLIAQGADLAARDRRDSACVMVVSK